MPAAHDERGHVQVIAPSHSNGYSNIVPLCLHQEAGSAIRRLSRAFSSMVVWWATPVEAVKDLIVIYHTLIIGARGPRGTLTLATRSETTRRNGTKVSPRSSALAAIGSRSRCLRRASDSAAFPPKFAHPASRSKHSGENSRDIVVDIQGRPMESGACAVELDLSSLRACCILKTLQMRTGNGDVNARGEMDDDLIVGGVIVRLDRTGPIIFLCARLRNGGIDLRVRRDDPMTCHACIASQAATRTSNCSAAVSKTQRTSLRFALPGRMQSLRSARATVPSPRKLTMTATSPYRPCTWRPPWS